ncbi:MAG TPA: ribonucleoside-triphosphate reductase, adenosylcobalamin-dependent, partial [Mobilitalea sp.]|nr:ribonucleoside-triphosphate reductase, adenosylcobalamin-dependent [Mobilitalea sp.]
MVIIMEHILKEEFLNKYRNADSPLSNIGEFVYLRTYARYLVDKKRRENWLETVLRTTEYNIGLGVNYKKNLGLPIDWEKETKEAEMFFDHLFHLRTFPSGRTLYMGGTEVVKDYPLSNYNCSFTDIKNLKDLVDVFYLLMVGSGVGVRISKKHIKDIPKVRHVKIESVFRSEIRAVIPKEVMEYTKLSQDQKDPSTVTIMVGDSKEGWCEALDTYFKLVTTKEYQHTDKIIIDYSYVRPEGERLK